LTWINERINTYTQVFGEEKAIKLSKVNILSSEKYYIEFYANIIIGKNNKIKVFVSKKDSK